MGLIGACNRADAFAGGDVFAYAVGRARAKLAEAVAAMNVLERADVKSDPIVCALRDIASIRRQTAYEIMAPWRNEFGAQAARIRRQISNTRVEIVDEVQG